MEPAFCVSDFESVDNHIRRVAFRTFGPVYTQYMFAATWFQAHPEVYAYLDIMALCSMYPHYPEFVLHD